MSWLFGAGNGGGDRFGGGGGGYGYGGGGGGGYGNFDYEAYRREQAEKDAARLKRHKELQAQIDAIDDPVARLEKQRKRYAKNRWVTLSQIPSWEEELIKFNAAEAEATGMGSRQNSKQAGGKKASSSGSGLLGLGGGHFMERTPSGNVAVPPPSSSATTSTATTQEYEPYFPPNALFNRKVSLYQGDITLLEIDAIVNAANNSCLGGGGIDGAIHDAAGPLLVDECRGLHGCATGDTKWTRGYALPAKFVLHTVGPIGSGDEELASCYRSILKIVERKRIRSVAICCVSTGIFSFPLERATNIALTTVREWMEAKILGKQDTDEAVEETPKATDDNAASGGAASAAAPPAPSPNPTHEDKKPSGGAMGGKQNSQDKFFDEPTASPWRRTEHYTKQAIPVDPSLPPYDLDRDLDRIIFCCFRDVEIDNYYDWIGSYFPDAATESAATGAAAAAPAVPVAETPAAESAKE